MVPACDFPASFDAFVAGFEAQEVEDKTSDGDEIDYVRRDFFSLGFGLR